MLKTLWKPVVAAALTVGALPLTVAAPRAQAPTLAEVLRLAGEYHAEYANRLSGVMLEELYQLIDVTGGKMSAITRIQSDVVFVNLNGGVAALRDAYAVDSKALRERTPRITALLSAPAASAKDWLTVIQFPAESSRYFALDLILKVNEPTFALRFMSTSVQPTLKYVFEGKKKFNGVETMGIRFDEPAAQDKQYLVGSRGNARASGRLWVETTTGAIHQTELWLDSKADTANITVKYAPHAALKLLLPSETSETYEEREAASGPRDIGRGVDSGRGGSRISYQAQAKYSKPTYAAIDLRTLKR